MLNEADNLGQVLEAPLNAAAALGARAAKAEAEAELKRPLFESFEIEGRTYLVDTTKKAATEVKAPKVRQLAFPRVGSLQGVAELVRRHADSANAAIVVGEQGIMAHLAISADEDEQRPQVLCPYFTGDNAPQGEFGVEALYAYLDRFQGRIGQTEVSESQEDAIWLAISSMKAVVADEYEVESCGAAISVTSKTKQGVTSTHKLPKYITLRQRLGVRDFQTERLYRLQALLPGKGREMLSFRLIHMDTDGSHERFVAWAVEGLNAILNDMNQATGVRGPWIISEGP